MMFQGISGFIFGTLRGRLIIGVALVHAVMMTLFIADLTERQRALLLSRQIEEATALSQSLAISAAGWIAADDVSGLQELVDAQRRYSEIVFAILADREGRVLATIDKSRQGLYLRDLPGEARQTVLSGTAELVDVAVPAMIGGRHVGWARIGIGQKAAGEKLAEITKNGIAYGLAANGLDRLRQIEAERRLEQANRGLAQRTLELEAANRELEEFSYSMSHDMRTPLRAVDGYSKLLLEEHGERLDAEGKRLLKAVRDNGQHMGRLIEDILRFIGMGRREMEFCAVDIAALAREKYAGLQAANCVPEDIAAPRLRLEIGELPPAWGDHHMLGQVLLNLLSNAIKFSPADADAVIEIGGEAGEQEDVYSIRDHGVGFDMRYADKLFKVFEHVHPPGLYEGTGIGLAIVKRIVERHGGRVWAEGRVGKGASFHFALPHRRM